MKRSFIATAAMLLAAACGGDGSRTLTAPVRQASHQIISTSSTGATVNTDKEDYAPGQVVTIVGKGWIPGETVHLNLTENPVADGPHDWNVTADSNGAFVDSSFSPGTQHIGVTFTLTASSASSGSAVASFTDGNVTAKTSGVTITVNWRYFAGNATCTGSPTATGVITANGGSPVVAHVAVAGESVELTALSTASGQLFSTWTQSSTTSSSTTVCAAGSQGTQNWLATYVSPPGNTTPIVSAGADATIDEGDTFTQSGSFTDPDANSWTATVDYGDGSGVQSLTLSGKNFTLSHQYTDNGSYTVTVSVNDGTVTATDQVSVTVNNVAPTATFGNDGPVNEGSAFQLSLAAPSDPSTIDAASLHYAFDCGDGTGYGTAVSYATSSSTSTKSCSTNDNGTRSVKGRIYDKDGASTEYTASVTVNNVSPTATFGNNGPVNEGTSFQLSLSSPVEPSSVDAGSLHYAFDCGDGSGYGSALTYATSGASSTKACSTSDNGSRSVKGKIFDKDGGSSEYSGTVTVNNVAPSIASLSVTPALIAVNNQVTGSASFGDAGTGDTHTASWNWGDGSSSSGVVTESNGSGTVAGSHTYNAAGVYTVSLTVTDDDGGSDSETFEFVVVYDPSAGFVTGGGWINSPAGACRLSSICSGATGKANFGFVSKYLKGATTPTGNTEFQFQAGNLNFKSTVYEWLVISGARAQYKGAGTINGQTGYQFILTAIDADAPGGGDFDRFRIKIADLAGNIVYDNMGNYTDTFDGDVNADLSSNPATRLGGGSISIKTK